MKKSFFIRLFLIMIVFILSLSIFGCQEDRGRLYDIEEAYENGIIDKEALFNIAYYYNKEKNVNEDFDFSIQELNPMELSAKTSKKIRTIYLKGLKNKYPYAKPKLSDIHITNYYGTYNECVAVRVNNSYFAYDIMCYDEYFIDDIKFENYDSFRIYIWCEGIN